MAAALLGGAWISCESESAIEVESPHDVPAEIRPLPVDLEPTRIAPRLHAAANELTDGESATGSFEVGSGYRLEFVPVSLRPSREPLPLIEVLVEVDGSEELVAKSAVLDHGELAGTQGIRAMLEPVGIDLEPYRGRTVRIHWRLAEGTGPRARVAIANPRLLPARSAARPDVLFICSDTHRYDYSFAPEEPELMPALAALLRESVTYTRSYSTASWTMPSIASALTGLFSRYHGVGRLTGTAPIDGFDRAQVPAGHFAFKPRGRFRFLSTYSDELLSLPEILRGVGYTTVIVAGNPLYFLSGLAYDGTDLAVSAVVERSERINELAFAALESADPERPLFLLVHYMDLHQWERWFLDSDAERGSDAYREAVLASYRQGATTTDAAIAELLARWTTTRGAGAIIVFYADHGEHLLDPPDGERIGHGNSMDDVLLHVPLAIRFPEAMQIELQIEPGTVNFDASLADVTPTLLDALGLDTPAMTNVGKGYGRSLIYDPAPDSRTLFADFQLYGTELSSVRSGDAKLVLDFEEDRMELIDVRTGETLDLDTNGDIARDLLRAFRDYERAATEYHAKLSIERTIDPEEATRSLEALGYVN